LFVWYQAVLQKGAVGKGKGECGKDYGNEGAEGLELLYSSSLEEPLVYIYQQTN